MPALDNSINFSVCRSQLYKELKEVREKVAQLELQLFTSATKVTTNCYAQDKENSAPLVGVVATAARGKLMKRLVGRGLVCLN